MAIVVDTVPQDLVLYSVQPWSSLLKMRESGKFELEGSWYIGLRERLQDAVYRAQRVSQKAGYKIDKSSHGVLQIRFSALDIGHYARCCGDLHVKYQPLLHKVVYNDHQDWGVWYFIADLPLAARDLAGNILISCECFEIK
jgi:hypothetical protein